MANQTFSMDSSLVDQNGKAQEVIAENFRDAKVIIYTMIGQTCGTDWKGLGNDAFKKITDEYSVPMDNLANAIEGHGKADINSSRIMSNADSDIAANMR